MRSSPERCAAGRGHLRALLVAPALALSTAAWADPVDNIRSILSDPRTSPLPPGWLVGGMAYAGDSTYAAMPRTSLAFPGAVYVGRDFSYLGDRAFYNLHADDAVTVYARARVRLGNLDPKDSPAFTGMRARKAQLEAGLGANAVTGVGMWTARFSSDISGRSRGHEVLLSWTAPLVHERWILAPGFSALWRSSRLAGYYYGGVDPSEAAAGRPAYSPAGSWSFSPSLGATYRASAQWLVAGMAWYEHVGVEIRRSPLVQRNGWTGVVIAAGYVWH